MKDRTVIPGSRIEDEALTVAKIMDVVNPNRMPALEAMKTWMRLGLDKTIELLHAHKDFYIYRTHPVHSFKNALYVASSREVVGFVTETINPSRREGLDCIVAPTDLSTVLVFNHDGDIFLARKT